MRRLTVTLPPDIDQGIERFRQQSGHTLAASQIIHRALRDWIAANAPPSPAADAADLQPFVGRWVALREGAVIAAAEDPEVLLDWLETNDERADLLLPVPDGGGEAQGEWSP